MMALMAIGALSPVWGVRVCDLECEALTNPLGIEAPNPRLSWRIDCDDPAARGIVQASYRILVSSSLEALAEDRGDLWDSGKVTSDQCRWIPYAGQKLTSAQTCYWKVKVSTKQNGESDWSEAGSWQMGLLTPEEWTAKWIGNPPQPPLPSLEGAFWIWSEDADGVREAPAGKRRFRATLNLPHIPLEASGMFTGDDRFRLLVNGHDVGGTEVTGGDDWRKVVVLDVSAHLKLGRNTIEVEAENRAGPAGIVGKILIGDEPVLLTGPGWEAAADDSAKKKWQPAKVLAPYGEKPWGTIEEGGSAPVPAPMLRREFRVSSGLVKATAFVSGVGYGLFTVNGVRPDDRVLDPPFTRYDKRVLYSTYDITPLLKDGANAVGLVLGNGFLNVPVHDAWDFEQAPWRMAPAGRVQIHLQYADGSIKKVQTDGSWKAGEGGWRWDAVRQGERYDARLEKPGWDLPGFQDAVWPSASVVDGPKGRMVALRSRPCRVTETIRPASVKEPKPGVFVFDLGQNIAGWVRIRLQGKAGTEVRLRFAEKLDPDGTIDMGNINTLVFDPFFSEVRYTVGGRGSEEWESAFAYYGFQYVQVEGWPGVPTLDNLDGRVVQTDFQQIGDVESIPFFDKLQELTRWAYRSNFVGIPTDCPHREKNGWMGDAHLAAEQGLFNFNNGPGYMKWIDDMVDVQSPEGSLPGIVPTGGWGFQWGNGPAWDSALILIPWYLYVYTGDLGVLDRHFDAMCRYVDYLEAKSKNYIIDFGLGDWVPAKTETPVDITSTAYFAVDADVVSVAAALLGKPKEAVRYDQLASNVRAAFRREFAKPDGTVGNASQTALSCAVFQNMLSPARRNLAVQKLVEGIEANEERIDIGLLGHKYLFDALSENGHHDLAFRMLTRTDQPSYGWWMEQGATTLWETWDGVNSRNHIMFGDVSAWLMKQLGGIRPDPTKPGFKRILLQPRVTEGVPSVRAWHDGPYGRIVSSWKVEGGRFFWDVTVPPNSTCVATIPVVELKGVTEGGQPLRSARGVKVRKVIPDVEVVVGLESGTYRFEGVLGKAKP